MNIPPIWVSFSISRQHKPLYTVIAEQQNGEKVVLIYSMLNLKLLETEKENIFCKKRTQARGTITK